MTDPLSCFRYRVFLPFALLPLVFLYTCGKDSPTEPAPQTPSRISLSATIATLNAIGESFLLTATVLDQEGKVITGAALTWRSNNTNVATVTGNGQVTAAANGTAQITATAGNASASATITVAQAASRVVITPATVTLNSVGETLQLEAAAYDANNAAITGARLAWSSEDPAVVTVSASGLVTAVANGSTRITATSGDGSASANAAVTVSQAADRIEIQPAVVTFTAIGDITQLTVTISDDNGVPIADADVVWTSDDPAVATVNDEGLVTAVANGATLITAASGTARASAVVTIMQSAGRITLEPTDITLMAIGETAQLTAMVTDSLGEPIAGAEVGWSSNDPAVAKVDDDGLVTAVANGTTLITASAGSATATATVTVMQDAGRITISPESASLTAIGQTAQLDAVIYDTNDQEIIDAVANWTSSHASIATIDNEGLVTAISNGTARVTATSGNASASSLVTVRQVATSIAVTPPSATLTTKGETAQLTATVRDANDHAIVDAPVHWSSGDSAVATVTQDGLVTAVSSGTAQITAASGDASAEASVTVALPVPFRIEISPASATLAAVGDSVQLLATVYDVNSLVIADAGIAWSSSDESVATVDTIGLVTGVSSGSAMITASSGDVSGEIEVKVAPPVVGISLSPPSPPTLTALGETLQMTATPRDADGELVLGAPLAWSSSHPRVATVNDSGLVTATGNGGSRITSTSGEVTASLIVTVSQVAVQVVITPTSPRLSVGNTLQLTANVLDANDGRLRGAAVTWDSRNLSVATVSVTGLVRAVANGSTRITATSGDLAGTVQVVVEPGHEEDRTLNIPGSLEDDREGLVALYNALDGDNWTNNTNWLSDEPLSTWHGVTLWNNVERVGAISLQSNGLSGTLPAAISKISGLGYLRLSDNAGISGSIPSSIGQLTYLRWIHLLNTSVSGSVPSSVSQLVDLEQLFIRSDNLTGSIPAGLTGLTKLRDIEISGGSLTGTIPSGFGSMSQLRQLSLSGGLTGSIPTSLGQLRQLEQLAVPNNALTGNIPAALGQVTSLRSIFVENNANMSGTLPHALTNLMNLNVLSATGTQLCRPSDEAFTTWYESRIPTHRRDQVVVCP